MSIQGNYIAENEELYVAENSQYFLSPSSIKISNIKMNYNTEIHVKFLEIIFHFY